MRQSRDNLSGPAGRRVYDAGFARTWEGPTMKRATLVGALIMLAALPRAAAQRAAGKDDEHAKALAAARQKGLAWLTKTQAANGSWGKQYTVAVTSFAILSYLSPLDEPFDSEHAKAIVK